MSLTLYEITVPPFIAGLKVMSHILDKGKAWAEENGKKPEEFLTAQLNPDMKNLIYQVQRASDSAKGAASRIGGIENVSMEDNETTFEQVQVRISKTIEFLQGVPKESFDGKLDQPMDNLPDHFKKFGFTYKSYVTVYAIPNFYFHKTTTYAILRMVGVPVGKLDYLMGGQ